MIDGSKGIPQRPNDAQCILISSFDLANNADLHPELHPEMQICIPGPH